MPGQCSLHDASAPSPPVPSQNHKLPSLVYIVLTSNFLFSIQLFRWSTWFISLPSTNTRVDRQKLGKLVNFLGKEINLVIDKIPSRGELARVR